MTSPQSVFYLMFLFFGEMAQRSHQSSSVHQESSFISANVGENITLKCVYKDEVVARFYWYKQTLGQKPRLISSFYSYDKNGTFYDECQNNPRFTLDTGKAQNHLNIRNLQISDSATYFCASSYSVSFSFAEGITLSVKGSGLNLQPLVQQSAPETIQPGGSVTLNCTVHTGTCDGEHSVYWFKDTEEPHSGLIYTNEGRNDECERKPKTNTNTCVYNFPLKNLNVSHAGTYYCAVASCGYMIFGNGTKLDLENDVDSFALRGAFAFTTILSILLVPSLCVIIRVNSCVCPESHARFRDFFNKDEKDCQHILTEKTDNTWSECVYFHLKQ
ncbi:immunoglobulin kappa light chain-like [Archocentrus centrarchus]|uniref:immunoglobulin kappa light chain-like n=1 Tax=Archocentrus centrarchus TaxID=63155 RepID=UPI0011EA14A2|nr:immunoglobulin kappa light chain-like [Archocentrus centrarchus]